MSAAFEGADAHACPECGGDIQEQTHAAHTRGMNDGVELHQRDLAARATYAAEAAPATGVARQPPAPLHPSSSVSGREPRCCKPAPPSQADTPALGSEEKGPAPSTRRTIPDIRARLHELAKELACPELAALAEETKRRPPVRSAPRRAFHITPELAEEVRAYAGLHPTAHMRSIGQRFRIDQGRVSEILAGKRGE